LRILLDTHALVWWLYDAPLLSRTSREHLGDASNALVVSAASAWELAIKFQLGRLPEAALLVTDFSGLMEQLSFELLPISAEHGIRAGTLPGPHKDPFDRMLVAQSQAENIPILSNDTVFDSYGVRRLW
jgi:PIN domain nuclease of toxin-antitoxin system